jgi:hypothetical protein
LGRLADSDGIAASNGLISMTIFKKGIHTWVTLILSLVLLNATVFCLARVAYRSDATEIETDTRYAKVIAEIRDQKLDVDKVRTMAAAEGSPGKKLFEDTLGVVILFVSYSLIFRCVARVILGAWKSPWIS